MQQRSNTLMKPLYSCSPCVWFEPFYQESPTHQSVFHVNQELSAMSQVPPLAAPVLGTPSLAMAPAPAPPVTPPPSTQVRYTENKDSKSIHLFTHYTVWNLLSGWMKMKWCVQCRRVVISAAQRSTRSSQQIGKELVLFSATLVKLLKKKHAC